MLADLERLSKGSYTVKWRVTSIDGHVVEGRYAAVVAAGEDRPPSEDAGTEMTQPKPQGRSGHHAGTTEEVLREEAPPEGEGPFLSPPRDEPQVGLQVSHRARPRRERVSGRPGAVRGPRVASGQQALGRRGDAIRSFGMLAGGLLLALALAGVGELSSYAVLASGTPECELFWQTLFDSRSARSGWPVLAWRCLRPRCRRSRGVGAHLGMVGGHRASAVLLMTLSGLSRRRHGPPLDPPGRLDPRCGRGGLDGRLAGLPRRPVLRSFSEPSPR